MSDLLKIQPKFRELSELPNSLQNHPVLIAALRQIEKAYESTEKFYGALRKRIKEEKGGVLVIWQNYIIGGHLDLEISKEVGVQCEIKELEETNELKVLIWMFNCIPIFYCKTLPRYEKMWIRGTIAANMLEPYKTQVKIRRRESAIKQLLPNRQNKSRLSVPQELFANILELPTEYKILTKAVYGMFDVMPRFYKIDIAEPENKIAIEIDGRSHTWNVRKEVDARKKRILNELGWTVIRFTNEEVMELFDFSSFEKYIEAEEKLINKIKEKIADENTSVR